MIQTVHLTGYPRFPNYTNIFMHHVKPCIPLFLQDMFAHDDFPGQVISKVVSLSMKNEKLRLHLLQFQFTVFHGQNIFRTELCFYCLGKDSRKCFSISWVQIWFPQKLQKMSKMNTGNQSSTEIISFSAEKCTGKTYRR